MGCSDPPTRESDDAAGGVKTLKYLATLCDVPKCRRQVSCSEEDGGQPQWGHHPLLLGGPEHDSRVPPAMDNHEQVAAQQHLALHRCHDEASQTGPLAVGAIRGPPDETVLGPDCITVRQLMLSNPSNHCYFNSTLLALGWLAALSPPGLTVPHVAMGRFLRWLFRSRSAQASHAVALWSLRPWRSLLAMWQEPHQQHDAAEFLQFLAPLLIPYQERQLCCWQARELSERSHLPSSQAVAQVVDQGTLWPMTVTARLVPPMQSSGEDRQQSPPSLQSLLIQWRNQAARHARTAKPDWLVLQVSRFDDAGCKLVEPAGFSEAVYIPFFTGQSLATSSARYRVSAVIYHLGPTLLSGHYRSALCQAGSIQLVTDDGTPARQATVRDVQQIQSNVYLFFLRKC